MAKLGETVSRYDQKYSLFSLPFVETAGTLFSAAMQATPWAVGIGAATFVLNTVENVTTARKEGKFPSVSVLRQIPEASIIAVALAVGHPEVAIAVYLAEQAFQEGGRLRRALRQRLLN